jgi:hypothetical protein
MAIENWAATRTNSEHVHNCALSCQRVARPSHFDERTELNCQSGSVQFISSTCVVHCPGWPEGPKNTLRLISTFLKWPRRWRWFDPLKVRYTRVEWTNKLKRFIMFYSTRMRSGVIRNSLSRQPSVSGSCFRTRRNIDRKLASLYGRARHCLHFISFTLNGRTARAVRVTILRGLKSTNAHEESWRKHELVMWSRDNSHIIIWPLSLSQATNKH